ncbi:MAG: UvrB/UvrC motif-containing protein [Candidatus Portnoybacteria bacterium]|nr:UvrB/UvrC motif-containing protein [Candidatus Portnoybacteria bacterium]
MFKNKDGTPLYVGKAARLRDRVKSYFIRGSAPFYASRQSMLSEIADIEVEPTDSEIEALLLESRLIKTLKPRYNILMRDDKQYFYVGFTDELFPKLFLTHQQKLKAKKLKAISSEARNKVLPKAQVLISYIGPFVNGRSLKITLRVLRKIFPYCTCKRLHKSEKACLNYHIGIDPGYCCTKSNDKRLKEKVKEYKNNIARTKSILKGQRARVLNELERGMKKAAKVKDFEQAAKLRDQWESIQKVLAHKRVIEDEASLPPFAPLFDKINRIEGYDISNIQGAFAVGSLVVCEKSVHGIFIPKKSDYRRFKIKTVKGANDPAMLEEVIKRRLKHLDWPLADLLLIDGGISQRNAALKVITLHRGKQPLVWSIAKGEETLYTAKGKMRLGDLLREEANTLRAVRDEAHRFAISYYRKLHRKGLIISDIYGY